MKELEKLYQAKKIETNKYDFWLKQGYFKPTNQNKVFSMIIPPPNVTGVLHLGHALDVAIQDLIVRFKKLNGYQVCWVPGTDHAGIATQTKFEAYLKNEKKQFRKDMERNEFLNQLQAWAQIQSNTIHEQWKKMGLCLDYDKEKFTMDDDVNKIVNEVFVELYQQGLIYQGEKIINWDVKLQTAISDIEVKREPTKTKLYYFKYYLDEAKKEYLLVATTRPETMFGDVCLFINPNDERYKTLLNKKVLNPANQQWIPILGDEYIDIEFGTGVMKCTPAHDFNDNDLAKKHHLPVINILNPDGTMNHLVPKKYQDLDRLKCRDLFVEELQANGFVDHIDEEYISQIGYSERTNEIIEPYISKQWFLKMEPLAKKVLSFQQSHEKGKTTTFLPTRFNHNLEIWLNNIQDWCISRQLWWGHQLPIWYHKQTKEIYVSTIPPQDIENWERDSDVLDTWFSSGLWPLVCFGWKTNQTLFDTYFPTSMLVTGYDILTFWVSRMMMLSVHFTNKTPFDKVYIHGLIRDSQGRKMSKSLGNGVDPMQVIDEYGCDTLRLFLTSSSTIGEDLRYYPEKLKANWAFLNKLWNSARFIFSNIQSNNFKYEPINLNQTYCNISNWILNKYQTCLEQVTTYMNEYNFVVSTKYLTNFVYEDFCSNFLELSKVLLKQNQNVNEILNVMLYVLKNILIMLHSQCPFITEEIYQCLPEHLTSIMLETWPAITSKVQPNDHIDNIIKIINAIRRIRLVNKINNKERLLVNLKTKNSLDKTTLEEINFFVNDILNIEIINSNESFNDNECLIEILDTFTLEIKYQKNNEQEIEKLTKLIEKLNSEIKRSLQILNNQAFIDKAPAAKVKIEQEKLLKYQDQLAEAQATLNKLIK